MGVGVFWSLISGPFSWIINDHLLEIPLGCMMINAVQLPGGAGPSGTVMDILQDVLLCRGFDSYIFHSRLLYCCAIIF